MIWLCCHRWGGNAGRHTDPRMCKTRYQRPMAYGGTVRTYNKSLLHKVWAVAYVCAGPYCFHVPCKNVAERPEASFCYVFVKIQQQVSLLSTLVDTGAPSIALSFYVCSAKDLFSTGWDFWGRRTWRFAKWQICNPAILQNNFHYLRKRSKKVDKTLDAMTKIAILKLMTR